MNLSLKLFKEKRPFDNLFVTFSIVQFIFIFNAHGQSRALQSNLKEDEVSFENPCIQGSTLNYIKQYETKSNKRKNRKRVKFCSKKWTKY